MAVEMQRQAVACEVPALEIKPTLPGTDYWSPEVFKVERERIFHGGWICVGREEQLPRPGDYFVRDILDESVLVVRDTSGRLGAFYNVCRHRGSRLCDGEGHLGAAVRCPYHSWTYALDGRLLTTPNVGQVEGFDKAEYPLRRVALEAWQGFIFVNMAEEPGPLMDQLGLLERDPRGYERYGMDDLRTAHRIVYDVAANWKVLVENYSECLHCPGVHPELVKFVPLYRRGLVGEFGGGGAILDEGLTSLTVTGSSNRPPLPGLTEEDRKRYDGIVLLPNLLINLHPDYVMSYILYPVSPERTTVVSEYLFEPSTISRRDFDPSDAVEFWDLVSRQDWDVCQRVQRGVRSRGYGRGVYPPQDLMVYEFNRHYLKLRDGEG